MTETLSGGSITITKQNVNDQIFNLMELSGGGGIYMTDLDLQKLFALCARILARGQKSELSFHITQTITEQS